MDSYSFISMSVRCSDSLKYWKETLAGWRVWLVSERGAGWGGSWLARAAAVSVVKAKRSVRSPCRALERILNPRCSSGEARTEQLKMQGGELGILDRVLGSAVRALRDLERGGTARGGQPGGRGLARAPLPPMAGGRQLL